MAIYGPNASGKTCIIRALSALREIALGSPAARFYLPNRLLDPAGPMTVTCGFCTGNQSFVYDVTLGNTGITAEILSCDGKELFCVGCGHDHFDGLTTPGIYTADRLLEIYQTECLGEEGEQRRSFLSRLGSNYFNLSDAAAGAHRYLTALEIYPENRFAMFSDLERLQNMSWDSFAASWQKLPATSGSLTSALTDSGQIGRSLTGSRTISKIRCSQSQALSRRSPWDLIVLQI